MFSIIREKKVKVFWGLFSTDTFASEWRYDMPTDTCHVSVRIWSSPFWIAKAKWPDRPSLRCARNIYTRALASITTLLSSIRSNSIEESKFELLMLKIDCACCFCWCRRHAPIWLNKGPKFNYSTTIFGWLIDCHNFSIMVHDICFVGLQIIKILGTRFGTTEIISCVL